MRTMWTLDYKSVAVVAAENLWTLQIPARSKCDNSINTYNNLLLSCHEITSRLCIKSMKKQTNKQKQQQQQNCDTFFLKVSLSKSNIQVPSKFMEH